MNENDTCGPKSSLIYLRFGMKFLRVAITLKKKNGILKQSAVSPIRRTFAKAASQYKSTMLHQLIRRFSGTFSSRFKPSVLDYLLKNQSWIVYCPILEEIRLQIDVL